MYLYYIEPLSTPLTPLLSSLSIAPSIMLCDHEASIFEILLNILHLIPDCCILSPLYLEIGKSSIVVTWESPILQLIGNYPCLLLLLNYHYLLNHPWLYYLFLNSITVGVSSVTSEDTYLFLCQVSGPEDTFLVLLHGVSLRHDLMMEQSVVCPKLQLPCFFFVILTLSIRHFQVVIQKQHDHHNDLLPC